MAGQPLRIALLGAGTVGREVVGALLGAWAEERFALAGVAVRDLEKARARGIPPDLLTDAPAHLVTDGVDVVVELMGGEEPAWTIIAAALGAGLPVVTANKHVLARHGAELEAASRKTGAPLRYEAAVMGGTPILRLLAEDLAGAGVRGFRGIVNGTTNYILSQMSTTGLDYDTALAQAQAAGYAEADPTGDVEGGDAADKLVILVRLAFGAWVDRSAISCSFAGGRPGITGVTADDLAAAKDHGLVIKLLASATRGADGVIEAVVRPTAIDDRLPLASTAGVQNRVEIESDRLGWLSLEGPGAGGAATAAAVLADLVAILARRGSTWGSQPAAGTAAAREPQVESVFKGPSGASYPVIR